MGFCLNKMASATVEALLLIIEIGSLVSYVYGLIKVDWRITREQYHVLYILSFIFVLVGLIICISFIFLRRSGGINTWCNVFCLVMAYFMLLLNIFSVIFTVFSFCQASSDYKKFDASVSQKVKDSMHILASNGQWSILNTSMSFPLVFDILQLPFWFNEITRLKYKIDGPIGGKVRFSSMEISD